MRQRQVIAPGDRSPSGRPHVTRAATRRVAAVTLVTGMLVLATMLSACGSGSATSGSTSETQAAPLKGTTLQGQTYDLAAHTGKPVVVNFFASWCPPCNSEAPDLAAFAKAHPEVDFVGVDVNDKQADAQAFVAKYGLPYPIVYDPNGEVGSGWNVNAIPATFFIDKDGVVKDSIVGAADSATFESKLKSAL